MSIPRVALEHPEILYLMQQCRYTTLSRLQRAFPLVFTNERTGRRWMQRLRDAELIKTVPYSTENVHSLTANGVDFLSHRYEASTVAPDEARNVFKLEHELAITDLQLDLHFHVANRPDLRCVSMERRFTTQLPYRDTAGRRRHVQPDLGATIIRRRSDGSDTVLWLAFEIDLGNEKTDYFQAKQDGYDAWNQQHGLSHLRELYTKLGYAEAPPVYRRAIITRHRTGADDRQLARLFTTSLVSTHRDIYHAKLADIEADRRDNLPLSSASWYAVSWFNKRRRERIRRLFRTRRQLRSGLYDEVGKFLGSRRQLTSLV